MIESVAIAVLAALGLTAGAMLVGTWLGRRELYARLRVRVCRVSGRSMRDER
jgi:hypothetical protein